MIKFILLFISLLSNTLLGNESPKNESILDDFSSKRKHSIESNSTELSKKHKITTERVYTSPELTLSPRLNDYTPPTPLGYSPPSSSSDHNSSPTFDEPPISTTDSISVLDMRHVEALALPEYGKLSPALINLLNINGTLITAEDTFVTALYTAKSYIFKNRIYTELEAISKKFDQIIKDNKTIEDDLNKLRLEFREKPKDHEHQEYNKLKWRTLEDWNFEKWPHQSNSDALLGYLFFPKELEDEYMVPESVCKAIGPQISLAFSAKYQNPLAFYSLYLTLKPGGEYKYTNDNQLKEDYRKLKSTALIPKNRAKGYYKKYSDTSDFIYAYLLLKRSFAKKESGYIKNWDKDLIKLLALREAEDPRIINLYAPETDNPTAWFNKSYALGYKKAAYGLCSLLAVNNVKARFESALSYAQKDNLSLSYRRAGSLLQNNSNIISYKDYPALNNFKELVLIIEEREAIIVKLFELAGDTGDIDCYDTAAKFIEDYITKYNANLTEEYKYILYDKIKSLYKKWGDCGYSSGYYNLSTTLNNNFRYEEAIDYDIKAMYYTKELISEAYEKKMQLLKEITEKFHNNRHKLILSIANLSED